MKTRTNTLTLGLVCLVILTSSAKGQSLRADASIPTQKMNLATSEATQHNGSGNNFSTKEVSWLSSQSVSWAAIQSMQQIAGDIDGLVLATEPAQFAKLETGATKHYVVEVKSSSANSMLGSQRVNVSVNYDAQPIGGILNVKVELVPLFSGVGIGNRPVASKSMAQAVDKLDQAEVAKIVKELTAQITQDFTQDVN